MMEEKRIDEIPKINSTTLNLSHLHRMEMASESATPIPLPLEDGITRKNYRYIKPVFAYKNPEMYKKNNVILQSEEVAEKSSEAPTRRYTLATSIFKQRNLKIPKGDICKLAKGVVQTDEIHKSDSNHTSAFSRYSDGVSKPSISTDKHEDLNNQKPPSFAKNQALCDGNANSEQEKKDYRTPEQILNEAIETCQTNMRLDQKTYEVLKPICDSLLQSVSENYKEEQYLNLDFNQRNIMTHCSDYTEEKPLWFDSDDLQFYDPLKERHKERILAYQLAATQQEFHGKEHEIQSKLNKEIPALRVDEEDKVMSQRGIKRAGTKNKSNRSKVIVLSDSEDQSCIPVPITRMEDLNAKYDENLTFALREGLMHFCRKRDLKKDLREEKSVSFLRSPLMTDFKQFKNWLSHRSKDENSATLKKATYSQINNQIIALGMKNLEPNRFKQIEFQTLFFHYAHAETLRIFRSIKLSLVLEFKNKKDILKVIESFK